MVKIVKDYYTRNACYVNNRNYTKKGIIVHSTATPGVMAKPFRDRWNNATIKKAVGAFLDNKEVVECLPQTREQWHVATHEGNRYWYGFEMCEDINHDPVYFKAAYKNAVEYTAVMVKRLKITVDMVLSHKEANRRGFASNHGDPEHWWSKYGYTMDDFRRSVAKELGIIRAIKFGETGNDVKELQKKLSTIGYNLLIDGSFGPATKGAVLDFQKRQKLEMDALVGPLTTKALDAAVALVTKPAPEEPVMAKPGTLFVVSLDAFANRTYAENLMAKARDAGFKPYLTIKEVS